MRHKSCGGWFFLYHSSYNSIHLCSKAQSLMQDWLLILSALKWFCEKSSALYSILSSHDLLNKNKQRETWPKSYNMKCRSRLSLLTARLLVYYSFCISTSPFKNVAPWEENLLWVSVTNTAVLEELIIDLLFTNQPTLHHLVNYPLTITYQPIIYQPNTDRTWTPTNQPTNQPPTTNQLTNHQLIKQPAIHSISLLGCCKI